MTDRFDELDAQDEGSIKYYDRDGEPIKMGTWCRLFGDYTYKSVARDPAGPFIVSTVWLGFDHGFVRGEPPIIFETMVFASPDGKQIIDWSEVFGPWRFEAEPEALAWHQAIVGKLRELTADESKRLTPGDVRGLLESE